MKQKRGVNIFPKNHKGQFYLIAAIIIIGLIIGFAAIKNYTQKKEVIKLYNLGEELGIESQNVLEYGTYNELNENDMEDLLTDFVESYADYAAEDRNLYFLFGNSKKFNFIVYQDLASEVSVDIGEGIRIIQTGKSEFIPKDGKIEKVVIKIGDLAYDFDLEQGENFYFVISQEIEGEQYVVTS